MAKKIDNKDSNGQVVYSDQSNMNVTDCDAHEIANNIGTLIKIIRGKQVMLDKDLATLYGVETKVLNQSVKRNIDRFPADFRFELN